jgi:hypothetical protein
MMRAVTTYYLPERRKEVRNESQDLTSGEIETCTAAKEGHGENTDINDKGETWKDRALDRVTIVGPHTDSSML